MTFVYAVVACVYLVVGVIVARCFMNEGYCFSPEERMFLGLTVIGWPGVLVLVFLGYFVETLLDVVSNLLFTRMFAREQRVELVDLPEEPEKP